MFRTNEELKQLEALRNRNEALKKVKLEMKRLKEKREELDREIEQERSKIKKEQESLDKLTVLKIHSSDVDTPDTLSSKDNETCHLLLNVLKLVSKKFSLREISGEFNRLNDTLSISLYMGIRVGVQLECQPAIDYFESLGGCAFSEKRGALPYMQSKVITLSIEQCHAAIEGLKLLNDPTEKETKQRHDATSFAKC